MVESSSQEIEGHYKLIKVLLSEPNKYKEGIAAIIKDIVYVPKELQKARKGKYFLVTKFY